jgi:PAS domain S-box-containing protein
MWSAMHITALQARLALLEQELAAERARRAFHEQILANVNDAVIVLDTGFLIQEWNTAAERIYGWKADDVRGLRLDAILKQRYPDGTTNASAWEQLAQNGLWSGQVVQTHRDGHEIWIESTVCYLRDETGAITGLVGINRDVTQRKQTEARLAHREAQLAGIIDSAMDAIITVDAEQRIVLFNNAAELVFGVRAAEVLGHTLDRFVPPEARAAHREHIPAFGRTGITRRSMLSPGVLQAVRADGTIFPIEASISQMRVEEQPFYTVILRDISERTRLEAQLLQAQKMESIGRLAGGVAHDFNNLLTVIIGGAELAYEALDPSHAARDDLQQVRAAGQRAAALTQQLLAFGRRQMLEPRVLDLNTLIRDTEQLLLRLIGEDVRLQTQLTANLAPVRADPHQLQQVLVNLAVNARDAMPTGGVLTITTTNVEIAPAMAEAYSSIAAGPHARILVSDTGVGMDAEVRARVFEPFFTTKEAGRGTGLGLATSYGIIKQHGGAIWVVSAAGKGTTFTIDLPAVEEAVEHIPAQHEYETLPRGHETILLVEDEASVRAFVERVLQGLGYTVLTAGSGVHALGLVQDGARVDLVLTDIVMPGMSGPVLAARLLRQLPQLRVIYMSGYAEHASLPIGGRSVVMVQKPFTQSDLARLVRRVLDGPPPR